MEIVTSLGIVCVLFTLYAGYSFSKKILALLKEIGAEIKSLHLFLESNTPVSMDSMTMTELAKEVQRREAFMGRMLDMVSTAVAAGIGKAFKR